ncbi:MAG: L-threonylcarbamoyladenylate synthase [Pseudomonadota bacterium]
MIKTRVQPATEANTVPNAVDVLRTGGLVAIPTETVYGLAADATDGEAVARIYEVKGRPSFNPLIVHCANAEMARTFGIFDDTANKLASAFWPGPLTLVLPHKDGSLVSPLVRAGLASVALRVPIGVSADIIAALGRPLAAPSANLSGRVSPTRAAHVMDQLGSAIDMILDAGACQVGLESTIISLAGEEPMLLRSGGVPVEEIEETLGCAVARSRSDAPVEAPGMMKSHYAPRAMVRLNATEITQEDGALNFAASGLSARHSLNLSPDGDLREAAANLFEYLAAFNRLDVKRIAVAPIPQLGLGAAINDRLERAAAPRA